MGISSNSLITFVPATAENPDLFRFVLTRLDYEFLMLLAENSHKIHELYNYCEVVTCNEQGEETFLADLNTATHYRCDLWAADLLEIMETTDLRPSDLYEYLGETKLIPTIHDLREAFTEYKNNKSADH